MSHMKFFKYFSEKNRQKNNAPPESSCGMSFHKKRFRKYLNFLIIRHKGKDKKIITDEKDNLEKEEQEEGERDGCIPRIGNNITEQRSIKMDKNGKHRNSANDANSASNANNPRNANNANVLKKKNFNDIFAPSKNFKMSKHSNCTMNKGGTRNSVERTKLFKLNYDHHKKSRGPLFKFPFLKRNNCKKEEIQDFIQVDSTAGLEFSTDAQMNDYKNQVDRYACAHSYGNLNFCKMYSKGGNFQSSKNMYGEDRDMFTNNMYMYANTILEEATRGRLQKQKSATPSKKAQTAKSPKFKAFKSNYWIFRSGAKNRPREEEATHQGDDLAANLNGDVSHKDNMANMNHSPLMNKKDRSSQVFKLNDDCLFLHDEYEKQKKGRFRKTLSISYGRRKKSLRPDNFTFLKVIGRGSYGKVLLVKHTQNNKLYAMKILRKENIISRNQLEHTKIERNVLKCVSHPFIVKLYYTFQTSKKLYFILEYCPGGELFFHLSKMRELTEEAVIFYMAEIILALQYLHKLNIIYRDVKPENVLLDEMGHIRLTDFGLSKEGISDNNSAKSLCGTPEYLAPEIIDQCGHGKAVDWWSLGIMLYEMLTGKLPFNSSNRTVLFKRIKHETLRYPCFLSPDAVDLLKKLFEKNPKKRLGSGATDAEEIKNHPFFKNVNWDDVLNKKVKPPFKPPLFDQMDLQNFDKEFLGMPLRYSDKFDSNPVGFKTQESYMIKDFNYSLYD
ncbi:AGC protein kinase [Plasmodium inui San Antonio 1]|uniref:AGC protein kinase n=1 Tax=Plasmodium inui San Antonio 1 TaxID=1237626 RepID=W6ZZY8_9APIC|nr:AGC protein kinase [Plasmodium inui San Antonio 1]EUD64870.1 AGC protein kinase [Plasmodium inui San Antonio 1]